MTEKLFHNLSKSWISWSCGKDSCFALMQSLTNPKIEVCGLLTTVTEDFERVSMHGVRQKLLEMQSKALGISLHIVQIPKNCTSEIYENKMRKLMSKAAKENISSIIFGDLFLEDIRSYREEKLKETGVHPLFPLWNYSTSHLSNDLINNGVKAVISCVDTKKLGREFVGRKYDQTFIDDLPTGVDPCGEYGEFHTFVYDAPIFSFPIQYHLGEIVERDGFCFIDILPLNE